MRALTALTIGLGLGLGLGQAHPLGQLIEARPPALAFDVQPPEAQLVIYGDGGSQKLGATGDGRFILERPRSNLGGADLLQCEFQCDGYLPQSLPLTWQDVLCWSKQPGGRCPTRVRLQPHSLSAYLRCYPWLWTCSLTPLLLLGLAVNWRERRKQSRLLARLQELVPDSQRQGDPLLGLALGNYRLVARLGSGGMASVYKALPKETLVESDAVAVKVIRLDADDAQSRQRFESEMAVTIQLDHPNIVRTLDWGWEGSRPYLVVEWLEGGPLSHKIEPGGMAIEQVRLFVQSIFAAVAYAHAHGFVHRDIKPDNVMLTRSGLLKLMDFGLARHQSAAATASLGMSGTPGYMAPEQIQPEADTQYFAADQYGLGVTVYQMLCGRRPYESPEAFELIRLQMEEEPPSILSFRADLGEALDGVLRRMLARAAADRFPDVFSARRALLEALNPENDPDHPGRRGLRPQPPECPPSTTRT